MLRDDAYTSFFGFRKELFIIVYKDVSVMTTHERFSFEQYRASLKTIDYYIYALCELKNGVRQPFYIGKGKGDRCLQHLKEQNDSEKVRKIQTLLKENRLGIDILRHGIKSEATASLIEATCIDLLGVGELTNKVRGSGTTMGRATLEELHQLRAGEKTHVLPEHKGLAFILNNTFKSGMSELELFEVTRGIWRAIPRDDTIQYAFATYLGIVKEVYEIHGWLKAGTQQYFTRSFEGRDISSRWEFIGRKATDDVRRRYVGNVIHKPRSYGNPFVKVGYDNTTKT